MDFEMKKEMKVADMILEVAKEFNDVPYTDLQGMAMAKAKEIIKEVQLMNVKEIMK